MSTPTKRPPFIIHKDLRVNDWVEIKYQGRTLLVALSSLLNAYKEKNGDSSV
jgi:hypothetical protein